MKRGRDMNAIKAFTGIALATSMLMATVGAEAAFSDQDDRAYSGTLACGGNHFNRLGGTEAQRSSYVLRNYGDTPIRIEQMTMYDATGAVIFSADGTSLPPFRNSLLGPGDNVLMPNQTTQINTQDILGESGLGRDIRPITVKFDWAADSKTILPDFSWVRFSRARARIFDPATGTTTFEYREERGRHLNNCRSISTNKGRGGDDKNED